MFDAAAADLACADGPADAAHATADVLAYACADGLADDRTQLESHADANGADAVAIKDADVDSERGADEYANKDAVDHAFVAANVCANNKSDKNNVDDRRALPHDGRECQLRHAHTKRHAEGGFRACGEGSDI